MNVQAGSARRPFNNTGVYGDEVPPVLIPNTEVKLISADGTWLDTARESMTMPVPKGKSTQQCVLFLFARIGPCPAPTRERLSGARRGEVRWTMKRSRAITRAEKERAPYLPGRQAKRAACGSGGSDAGPGEYDDAGSKKKSTQQCVLFLFANNDRDITGAPGRITGLL